MNKDGSRDVKCTEVALASVTCQFKPIGSLRSSANAGNSKINSSRAGSLFLAPFFSPALGCGSPFKQASLLAGYGNNGDSSFQGKVTWYRPSSKWIVSLNVCRALSSSFSCTGSLMPRVSSFQNSSSCVFCSDNGCLSSD